MVAVPKGLPGVVLMDTQGDYVPITGPITSLTDVAITSSALPTGAATEASLAALAAAVGSAADAPWSGSGSGTVISILKAIALNTAP